MFVTRFAPSPTGYLHLGHAFSALAAARAAKAAGGRLLLRIEDIDRSRCRLEYEDGIYEDLGWLGLHWETPIRRQSEHFDDYARALRRLMDEGLIYRCFKTRKEVLDEVARAPHLAADGPDGPAFTGEPLPESEERALLASGAPFAWRLSMSAARARLGPGFDDLTFRIEPIDGGDAETAGARPEVFGDAVIARKDAGTSYHLASVHDDALQCVTHVIRGADLAAAAHLHRLLQALLGYSTPVYRHHRLLTDETGKRLAKRDKAATLRSLRERGLAPGDIPELRAFY